MANAATVSASPRLNRSLLTSLPPSIGVSSMWL